MKNMPKSANKQWVLTIFVVCVILSKVSIFRLAALVYPTNQQQLLDGGAPIITKPSSFDIALNRTTRILYQHVRRREQEYWLSQPAPLLYIYDTLYPQWSDFSNISTCVDRKFQTDQWNNQKSCQWEPKICTNSNQSTHSKASLFKQYIYNYNIDVSYLKRFMEYPYTTHNPHEADLILVPYPHKSHCLCHKDFSKLGTKCRVPGPDVQQHVLNKLVYKKQNATLAARHLFLLGADVSQTMDRLRKASSRSFSLSLGPNYYAGGQHKITNPKDIVVPFTTREAELQPNRIATRPTSWWIRDRPYAVGAAFGTSPTLAEYRGDFLEDPADYIGLSMAGKPHAIHSLGVSRDSQKIDFQALYRNSTFCLILMGDECSQKRFFDAIWNGCIPVAALFTDNDNKQPKILSHRCPFPSTYPFSQGMFYDSLGKINGVGADVGKIILTYNGTCGFQCLQEPMERLLSNQTALQEHQLRLRGYALLTSFGLSDESYEFPDAFMATVVLLRNQLWHQMGRVPTF